MATAIDFHICRGREKLLRRACANADKKRHSWRLEQFVEGGEVKPNKDQKRLRRSSQNPIKKRKNNRQFGIQTQHRPPIEGRPFPDGFDSPQEPLPHKKNLTRTTDNLNAGKAEKNHTLSPSWV